ncbi:regulatory protein ToxS [Psychromonas sp. KJ10-10]|uniref:regulatory protein ToxS n=1 Tax=Psychromonas sp. KJ10-10 TaxID=3391823 RepID=UPI0039B65B4F
MIFKSKSNVIIALLTLILILVVLVFYFINNNKILTSKVWHSNIEIDITQTSNNFFKHEIKNLQKVVISGNIKHFKNNTYFQDITLSIHNKENETEYITAIAISGKWDYSQGYLFFETDKIDIIDIKDNARIPDKVKKLFKEITIKKFKQTKYIEPFDNNTLLMIDIDGSTSLWSVVMEI